MSTEVYSLIGDFPLGIDIPEIESEIISALPTFIVTSIVDDAVNFVFSSILSQDEQAILENIVATETANEKDIAMDGVVLDSLIDSASIYTKTAFTEDFFGMEIPWTWLCEIAGANNSVTMVDGSEGLIQLASEGNTNFAEINTKSKIVNVAKNQNLNVRLRLEQLLNVRVEFGAYLNNSNLIRFIYDAAAPNWKSDTTSVGVSTLNDTDTVADTEWHIFDVGMSAGSVNFLVDGAIVGVHTTNISTSVKYLYMRATSLAAANIQCTCDFVQLTGDR
jgi:hypothetical protein